MMFQATGIPVNELRRMPVHEYTALVEAHNELNNNNDDDPDVTHWS